MQNKIDIFFIEGFCLERFIVKRRADILRKGSNKTRWHTFKFTPSYFKNSSCDKCNNLDLRLMRNIFFYWDTIFGTCWAFTGSGTDFTLLVAFQRT